MPHCQSCDTPTSSEELMEHPSTGALLCVGCKTQEMSPPIQTQDFDYEVSYSKKNGFTATAKLGGSTVSLHVPQEELTKVLR